jgi:tetratricopeptide (TPR) repeat protein
VFLGAAWWFWQNRATWGKHAIFGLGFFVLMVAPVLGFITISYMRITWAADHFIYLPMIGLIALITAAVAAWYDRLPSGERPLLVAGCTAALAVLTWMSYGLAVTWLNEDELWTHTLQHNENAWQAHNRLGAKKFARGHVDDIPVPNPVLLDPATQVKIKGALHHFTRSTALRPDLGETHNNLGTALSAKGRLDEAIEQFKEAVRVTPHVPAIHMNLANALAAGNRFAEAEAKYLELIQGMEKSREEAIAATRNPNIPYDPAIGALMNNYGVAMFKQGKKDEAIAAFKRALAINPNLKDARESLAVATGEKPMPGPPGGPGAAPSPGQPAPVAPPLPMALPQSPTLGPTAP